MAVQLTEPSISAGAEQVIRLSGAFRQWVLSALPLAVSKGLRFNYFIDSALPEYIYASPDALTQIATHLLQNAIQYTRAGEIALMLHWRGSAFAIEVRDSGVGIPVHLVESLLHTSDSGTADNKGMHGLAVVGRLAQILGGNVMVRTELDVGSTFTVLLPLLGSSDMPTRP